MDQTKTEDMDEKWVKIATQAVTLDDFKNKLVKDPIKVMNEFGLNLPEGVRPNIDKNNSITLLLPDNPSEELQEEVTWWQWRLNTIEEFGKELTLGIQHAAPETEEGV